MCINTLPNLVFLAIALEQILVSLIFFTKPYNFSILKRLFIVSTLGGKLYGTK